MTNLIDEDVIVPTNTHLNPDCNICKFNITKKYKFVRHGILFEIFSIIVYTLALIVFLPITWLVYGIKVKGRKNLKKVKNAIFVSNHVLTIDFIAILTHALFFKRPYLITNHRPFKMPVVRRLVRLLRAIPLPDSPSTTKLFLQDMDRELSNGKSMLIFPEGAMWNYYGKIRPFMSGAFRFSVKNNVPIVPIVLTYRKPNWFYRLFGRKKPLITINILEPIKPSTENENKKEEEQNLEKQTYEIMQNFFNNNCSYKYISKQVRKILKN